MKNHFCVVIDDKHKSIVLLLVVGDKYKNTVLLHLPSPSYVASTELCSCLLCKAPEDGDPFVRAFKKKIMEIVQSMQGPSFSENKLTTLSVKMFKGHFAGQKACSFSTSSNEKKTTYVFPVQVT